MNGNLPTGASCSYLSSEDKFWIIHIEVRLSKFAKSAFDTIRKLVHQHLLNDYERIYVPSRISNWEDDEILQQNVESIMIAESGIMHQYLKPEECTFQIHVYSPSDSQTYDRPSVNPSDAMEDINAASVLDLPNRSLEGLWDSLYYEGNVKSNLLDYVYATVGFADAGVDYNLVSWNRIVLLHGPPGTGKTSLCRALAQKLSIRLGERYPHTQLLEINSHSLFSRWFSESGKLVQNLFESVKEMIEDEDGFVVLLIDEVESLTAARAGAMAGTEPSDALRVVNALLTQLDKLKHEKNVLVLATSNLAKAIDPAFLDRADIVQYIDLPPPEAIYDILRSCLIELMIRGVVQELEVPNIQAAKDYYRLSLQPSSTVESLDLNADDNSFAEKGIAVSGSMDAHDMTRNIGRTLFTLANKCKGMSGRSLRRLPVLAQARHIGTFLNVSIQSSDISKGLRDEYKGVGTSTQRKMATPVGVWLKALEKVVQSEIDSRGRLEH